MSRDNFKLVIDRETDEYIEFVEIPLDMQYPEVEIETEFISFHIILN